ncbi:MULTISPECIES: hypothetical protein [unclassified Microcoleus]
MPVHKRLVENGATYEDLGTPGVLTGGNINSHATGVGIRRR